MLQTPKLFTSPSPRTPPVAANDGIGLVGEIIDLTATEAPEDGGTA
jgi:hypothetical protein